jgi:hypothetical protein
MDGLPLQNHIKKQEADCKGRILDNTLVPYSARAENSQIDDHS